MSYLITKYYILYKNHKTRVKSVVRFIKNIKVNGLLRQIDRRRQQSRGRKNKTKAESERVTERGNY